MNNSFARRAPTNVALAILAVFGLVMASFAVARPTLAQHGNEDGPAVTPTVVAGNPVCPSGTVEVKFENDRGEVVSGSEKDFTIGGADANIEITWTDGYAFNYDTDGAEAAHVFVKGGDAANHYDYTAFPGGGVQHDDGLIAPMNDGNQQAAISHITFCFVATSEPTPTPTPTATPTPTPGDDAGILIEKEDEDGAPLAGAVFTVEGAEGEFTTGADGRVCVDGLPEDTTLTVTEIQAPAGYEIASPASRQVETDDDGCDRSPEVTFVNTLAEATPTPTPTEEPTPSPTEEPSATPTPTPTDAPTATPTPTEDEEPSVATPTPTPREDTAGGTPAPTGGTLPDTATAPMTGQVPAAALALLALFSMGVLLYARLAEARRRS